MTIFEPLKLHYTVEPDGAVWNIILIETKEVIASVPSVSLMRELIVKLEIAIRAKTIRHLTKEISLLSGIK